MNRQRVSRIVIAALICGVLSHWATGAVADAQGNFTIFDPPGSTSTTPSGITPDGVVTGSYNDASGVTHGFLRTLAGTFTTFDVPGSQATYPTAITPAGVIVGAYCPDTACSSQHGFVRGQNGTFTTFGPAGDFIFNGLYNCIACTPPPGITPAGVVAGTYSTFTPGFAEHGFLVTPDGTFTTFDYPPAGSPLGSGFTEALAINPAGVITGDYCDNVQCSAFLRAPDGTVTSFDPPGCSNSIGIAINPAGAVTGGTSGPGPANAFLRNPDGTFVLFTVPGALFNFTPPIGINPAGAITGYYCTQDFHCHGYLRAPEGTITSFDPPGSTFTVPSEINPAGVILGNFSDANGMHGFLFFPEQ